MLNPHCNKCARIVKCREEYVHHPNIMTKNRMTMPNVTGIFRRWLCILLKTPNPTHKARSNIAIHILAIVCVRIRVTIRSRVKEIAMRGWLVLNLNRVKMIASIIKAAKVLGIIR
jgi:hypothetical protein